jgi:hypothetical protein
VLSKKLLLLLCLLYLRKFLLQNVLAGILLKKEGTSRRWRSMGLYITTGFQVIINKTIPWIKKE